MNAIAYSYAIAERMSRGRRRFRRRLWDTARTGRTHRRRNGLGRRRMRRGAARPSGALPAVSRRSRLCAGAGARPGTSAGACICIVLRGRLFQHDQVDRGPGRAALGQAGLSRRGRGRAGVAFVFEPSRKPRVRRACGASRALPAIDRVPSAASRRREEALEHARCGYGSAPRISDCRKAPVPAPARPSRRLEKPQTLAPTGAAGED